MRATQRSWLLLALVAVIALPACSGGAAAAPAPGGRVTRVLPISTVKPRPATPEPWPKGWLASFCAARDAIDELTREVTDVIVIVGLDPTRIRGAANRLVSAGSRAATALRKVPAWARARPLTDAFWNLSRRAVQTGNLMKRFLNSGSQAAARSMVNAAKAYDRAALQLTFTMQRVNPGLKADCTG
jgi:hypothetical protein